MCFVNKQVYQTFVIDKPVKQSNNSDAADSDVLSLKSGLLKKKSIIFLSIVDWF